MSSAEEWDTQGGLGGEARCDERLGALAEYAEIRNRWLRGEPLPEWLLAELVELAKAFSHLPKPARHDAMKRNMSRRAWDYFTERADRRVRDLGEGEAEGPC